MLDSNPVSGILVADFELLEALGAPPKALSPKLSREACDDCGWFSSDVSVVPAICSIKAQ